MPPMPQEFDVAIVGGGASGTLTAAWLLRRSSAPFSIALLEATGRFATGVAYGTREPVHLLNVPAANMSADPDDPGHLLRWLRRRGHTVEAGSFVPRALYGDYLQEVLGDAEVRAAPGVELHRLPCAVTGYDTKRGALLLSTGDAICARDVVLALGNLPPAALRIPGFDALVGSQAYVASPWSPEVRAIRRDAHVIVLGSGLTAVDLLLTLESHEHKGPITVLSRHALLPRTHARPSPPGALPADRSPRALLRWVREQPDWRGAIDALRPITGPTWNAWSDDVRAQFDRHLRHLWEVHRHRMAPQIAERLDSMLKRSNLRRVAARLERVDLSETGDAKVTLQVRGGARIEGEVVVNCTGPAGAQASPILKSLCSARLARFDRYGLVTLGGQVVDAGGAPVRGLHAIGPMRRSELWETTAMPEIRVQAKRLAERLLGESQRPLAATAS